MKYDYPTAFTAWDSREHDAIARVMSSGQYTMAHEVEAFESEFAAFHARKHCIMVNSGSSANLIAWAAAGKVAGKIRLPALAWATTYAPVMQAGGDMKLIDCDDTWNAPQGDIIAPLLGNPIAPGFVAAVEDCCESFGAVTPDGKRCGTFGLLSTFSFFYSHQLSAIEGGAILTDDDDLARMCRLLRNHGWERGSETFGDEYRFVVAGYNLRPLEMHAAIARVQLLKVDDHAAARRFNWRSFAKMAEGLDIKMQAITSPDGFNPFCIAFTVPSPEIRETLAKALRADGIDCRPAVGGSFRLQPYGQHYEGPPTPNADRIHHTGMMLGCAPFLIPDEIERAVAVMRRYL